MNNKVFKINDDGVLEFCSDDINSVITIPYGVKAIGDEVFENRKKLERVIIPESVKTIGDWSFYHCKKLRSTGIPKGVIKIGKGAYSECDSLRVVILPNGVVEIGELAFSGCPNLVSISIPDSVKHIGENVFDDCQVLDISYQGTKEQWGRLVNNVNLGRVSSVRYHFNTKEALYKEDGNNGYRVDVTNGTCTKISIEETESNNVPIDMVLKLNTKDYTVLVSDNLTCSLRTKSINNKKPLWVNKLLALSKKNKKFSEDEDVTVQVSIKDTGNNTMSVYCFIHPNVDCIKIFSGHSEDFFYNKKVFPEWRWLPSYIQSVLEFYDWFNIACIDLFLTVDPIKYEPNKCKLIRGITIEKGLFGGVDLDYCDDGEYAISEIICLKD